MSASATETARVAADSALPDVPLDPMPQHWRSIPRVFVQVARAHWSKEAMADSSGTSLTYGSVLTRALALGRALGRELGPEKYVGVMVPPSVPAAVANLALLLIGKIPINLNYSASQSVIDAAVDQTGIQHVVTSKKVIARLKLTPKGTLIHLEDMPAKVGKLDKAWALTTARVVPTALLGSFLPGLSGDKLEATATIMFTSGSTGDPKGVVLTHGNVLSNIHQMEQHLKLNPIDVVCLGILPFFHSFGFTVTIGTILLLGKKAVYHSNPLDSKIIGDLCEKHKVTMLVGTPTFFRHYMQRCEPKQFASLFHLLLGAEKLKPEMAREIEETIKLRPLEGYGTTEMAPVACINVPFEVSTPDGRQVDGNRLGTVGRPMPGTAIKTTDPETGHDLPRGTEGMIHVKGPQIMAGYFDRAEATAKVLKDGWYTSGDLGYLDPDGFLIITGRLSRFAKVAGEMVPHEKVESAVMEASGANELGIAVTSIPDPKRGERIIVVHTAWETTPAEVCKKLSAGSMPKLWIPSADDFIQVEAIPILGTGKLDLRKLKEIAVEARSKA